MERKRDQLRLQRLSQSLWSGQAHPRQRRDAAACGKCGRHQAQRRADVQRAVDVRR